MTGATSMLGHNNPPSDIQIVGERLSDKERLLRSHVTLIKLIEAPSIINDEQEAGCVTDALKAVKGVIRKVSEIHKEVKDPYLECGRLVDTWKKRLETEFDAIGSKYAKPLNEFLERRAREERARQLEAARVERERAEAFAAEAQAHAAAGINDTANELLDAAVSTEMMAERMEKTVHTATPSQLTRTRSTTGASASQKLVWVGEIQNISAIDLNSLRSHFALDAIQRAVNAFVRDGGRQLDGVVIEQKAQLNVR